MNTRRVLFWLVFVIVLGLIVWGLIVAMNEPSTSAPSQNLGQPAPVSAADHVLGSSDAPVTLIEYSDFQCPACEAFYPLVTQLLSEASTTVRLVYRHFPLNDVLPDGTVQHPNALLAAQASEAASLQGNFWGMYNLLFKNHADWTELKDPHSVFIGYAQTLGLDVARFKTDLDGDATKNTVLAEKTEGLKLGIDSTPTFFVNGKAINNPQSYDQFKAIIEAAAK